MSKLTPEEQFDAISNKLDILAEHLVSVIESNNFLRNDVQRLVDTIKAKELEVERSE